ncbi:MAG: HlyU family transcriptional regulator [Pseudomonadales bacterium]
MSLFSSLKSLFSSPSEEKAPQPLESHEYKGFIITPAPLAEGSQFRVNGTISKAEKSHTFIRADILPTADQCADEMVRKSKLMIDQVGEGLF